MSGIVHGIDPPLMTYGSMIVCRQLIWPCANETCQRPECVRAKSMAAHPSSQGPAQSPVKPVTAPVEPVEVLCGPDGRYSITGLSEDDMYALASALQFTVTGARFDENTAERKLEVILWDALPD
jgi:hypothetical protein